VAALYITLIRQYVSSLSARYEELNDSYLAHVPSEDELLIVRSLYDDSQGPYTRISYFVPEQSATEYVALSNLLFHVLKILLNFFNMFSCYPHYFADRFNGESFS